MMDSVSLRRQLAPQQAALYLALFCAVIAALAELGCFLSLAMALSYLAVDMPLAGAMVPLASLKWSYWLGLLAACLLLKYLAYGVAYILSHRSAFAVLSNLRQALCQGLMLLPINQVFTYKSGQLKSIIMQDVERLEQFIAHHSVEFVVALVGPLLCLLLLTWVDYRLALLTLLPLPVAFSLQFFLLRRIAPIMQRYLQGQAELESALVEYVRNIPLVKLYSRNGKAHLGLDKALTKQAQIRMKLSAKTIPAWSGFNALLGANILLIMPLAFYLFDSAQLSLSEMILSFLLCLVIQRNLGNVVRFSSELREINTAWSRIQPLLRRPKTTASIQDGAGDASAELQSVVLSRGHRRVLDELSFRLKPGCLNAMVGFSGSGKSTVVELLSGFIHADSGRVYIKGVEGQRLSDQQRADSVAVVTQQVFIFSGSLKDNLLLARPQASDKDIDLALKVAGAQSFVDILPQGLATALGEQGYGLSGGERQRLALARGLLSAAQILILDEVTAFADSLTEANFYHQLKRHYGDKTVLSICHRLHAVESADQIIVLDQGRSIACGSHDQLLQSCDVYRRLRQTK